jgi:hypothetical protein
MQGIGFNINRSETTPQKKKTSSAHGKPLKQKQAFLSACHCKDTNSVELYRERRASNSLVSGCFHVRHRWLSYQTPGGYICFFFAVNTWWILLGDKQARRHGFGWTKLSFLCACVAVSVRTS